jgi:beta-lactamase regulating signal transducer with metallopeptidase domain
MVGVFNPKLLASNSVINVCTANEIACIAGHERGHFDARDNLKRWIMASLPDMLRWTAVHREIVDAWHDAAEDAADDATTGGEAMARAELAALLLKVVRLAPAPLWKAAVVSPFVEQHGLERRVRRLLRTRAGTAGAACDRTADRVGRDDRRDVRRHIVPGNAQSDLHHARTPRCFRR